MSVFAAPNAVLVLVALVLSAMPAPATEPGGSVVRIGPSRPVDTGANTAGDRETAKDTADAAPKDCVGDYLAALKRIRQTEFAALSSKPYAVSGGDLSLPGTLVFAPKPAPRSRVEMAALSTAAALAKGRGRPMPSADARWVAERLRSDLSDYLGQKPTPYLCGGVPQYIETLRKFAARAGTDPQRLKTLVEAQETATRRSVEVAFAAMKPVATPRFAPADRPNEASDSVPTSALDTAPTGAISGLRPSAGLSRAETTGTTPPAAALPGDPDLPPLKPSPPRSLATPADRAGAIDDLLTETRRAGFLAAAPTDDGAAPPAGEPVLQRLIAARAALRADPRAAGEESLRPPLAAFADIEALDYLQRAAGQKGDPQTRAVAATFDAILSAQKTECTCGG
jgi:hypothetical protein